MHTTEKLIEKVNEYVDRLYATRHIPDYVVEIYDDEDMSKYEYREDFTDEEIAHIMALKEQYGVPGFAKHLIEVFKDEAVLFDVAHGGEILDIRYEDKQKEADSYPIRFSRYEYDGSELECYPFAVLMPKRYYARLLRHCIVNPSLSFNMIHQLDPGLHQWLQSEIWRGLNYSDDNRIIPPFLIVMDQAGADALDIIKTLEQ